MKLYHHYHFNFRKYMHQDLTRLELSVWLHSAGRSLISVFIPVLLLVAGFSLIQVLIFYCIYCLIDAPLNLLARKLVLEIGAKYTIIIGTIAEIAYFLMLSFASFSWGMLIMLAIVTAIYDSFYWTAHWFVFNECIHKRKDVGRQVGLLAIFRLTGTLLAPLIGALLLIFSGKQYLLIACIALTLLSLVPLFRIRLDHLKPRSSASIREFFADSANRKNFLLIGFYAIHSEVEETILPIFVYLTFQSFGYVGALPIITSLAAIIFIYYIGHLLDHTDKSRIIITGAAIVGLIWLARIMFPSLPVIYLSTILIGLFAYMVMMTLDANIIDSARHTDMLDASTFRNAIHMASRGLLYGVLILAVEVFNVAFITAACAMFLLMMLSMIFQNASRQGLGSKFTIKNIKRD